MSESTNSRGLSVGAWIMLAAVIVGTPFVAVVVAIAVVYGVNPLMPATQSGHPLLAAASLVATLFAILAGIVFVIGDALYVILPSLSKDTARQGYASYGTVLASLLLAVVLSTVLQGIYLIGPLVAAIGSGRRGIAEVSSSGQMTPTLLIVAVSSLELSLLFVLWIRIMRPGIITWQDMGLRSDGLGRKALIGVGTGFAILAVAAAIESALGHFGIEQTQVQEFEAVMSATPLQFAMVLFAGAVVAPLAEESFFRGYIVKGFLSRGAGIAAFVFSSLLFAAAHLNLQAFVPIFAIGIMLAFVFWLTNSIVPTMVAHAMNNALGFIFLRYGDAIQHWFQRFQY